jgi:hypothetical protein
VADERLMYKALSIEIPDPNSPISTSTDKVSTRILDGIYALCVCFVGMIGVWKLEVRKPSSIPIVFESPLLLVKILPVDLSF